MKTGKTSYLTHTYVVTATQGANAPVSEVNTVNAVQPVKNEKKNSPQNQKENRKKLKYRIIRKGGYDFEV